MKTVLITGGTGLIGMHLSNLLQQKGYKVRHLSRKANPKATYPAFAWDLRAQTMDTAALEGIDAIINLAGAGIADKRWTADRKKEIIDSRVLSAQLLAKHLQTDGIVKPSVFIGCSAVGFYGNRANEILTEDSPPGSGFMSTVCQKWEESYIAIRQLGIRVPIIRVGVVLSSKGGALPELSKTSPLRIGSYFGSGDMYVPWIHIDDVCQVFMQAIENKAMDSIYNAVAPKTATSKELSYALEKALGKKMIHLPVPKIALHLMLGEMSAVVLNSTRAIPKGLESINYQFAHPNLDTSIADVIQRKV